MEEGDIIVFCTWWIQDDGLIIQRIVEETDQGDIIERDANRFADQELWLGGQETS